MKRLVFYTCPEHGQFSEWPDVDRIQENVLCPQCMSLSARHREEYRPPCYGIAPVVHGDVRRGYFSENLNRTVESKRDIREAQKEYERDGFVPLASADIKHAQEKARNRDLEAKRERRWRESAGPSTQVDSLEGYDVIA